MVDGRSHSLGLSSGGGKVHHQDLLHVECRLVQQGRGSFLLADKLALSLHHLILSVNLLGRGSCLLPLPKGVLSLEGRPVFDRYARACGRTVIMT
jgi:hypothetical protein